MLIVGYIVLICMKCTNLTYLLFAQKCHAVSSMAVAHTHTLCADANITLASSDFRDDLRLFFSFIFTSISFFFKDAFGSCWFSAHISTVLRLT